MALPKLKADTTEARLAGLTLPDGAEWAVTARKAALDRVARMGLPGKRDEYWRYTDPAGFNQPVAPKAAVLQTTERPPFDAVDRLKLVFVDGVFDASASDPLALDGIEISHLSDALAQKDHWVKDYFGKMEARGQTPVDRPLAALNTAFAGQGIVIRATARVSKPVNFVYLHRDETSDAMVHHVIRVDAGADFTLIENGPAAARLSKVTEVDVAEGGAFHHVRTQGRDHERRAMTAIFAQLAKDALFKSFTLTVNGILTRNENVIWLDGDGGKAHVAGACVGDGNFLHDDTVFITHDAVGCESRQVFKKVLRNGATGVFQGKILVKAGAQKTDGYQISQSLLLDDDSQFLAKPELEIYADDVACSHGSTSGAIDDTALFYLRSRGVPQKAATDLLTLAFLAEALQEIEDERLAADLQDRLEAWLARRR